MEETMDDLKRAYELLFKENALLRDRLESTQGEIMKEHKHAEVFLAAARGEAGELEVKSTEWGERDWNPAGGFLDVLYTKPDKWIPRRKQKTHVVNGFTVPEPLRDEPMLGDTYNIEYLNDKSFFDTFRWDGDVMDFLSLERGIAHATKEGAIANCKARLGIDPYKDES